ncbi:hypothetical protein F2P81_024975 [Scophthalmus maximus]|uniref:Uncharacterized protein n=1 Tax=Scophthalmus maximus TaxID=52904 RepID=A0A6A4RX14_SCOMX|nr:hypothetical protein F2P81_024975 [Scophthalmus maximus]
MAYGRIDLPPSWRSKTDPRWVLAGDTRSAIRTQGERVSTRTDMRKDAACWSTRAAGAEQLHRLVDQLRHAQRMDRAVCRSAAVGGPLTLPHI